MLKYIFALFCCVRYSSVAFELFTITIRIFTITEIPLIYIYFLLRMSMIKVLVCLNGEYQVRRFCLEYHPISVMLMLLNDYC
jgi:hypothetical protein